MMQSLVLYANTRPVPIQNNKQGSRDKQVGFAWLLILCRQQTDQNDIEPATNLNIMMMKRENQNQSLRDV